MGLKQEIENDINEAFDTDLEDAVKQFTHRKITVQYEPDDGTSTETVLTDNGRGAFGGFSKEELADSNILPTDVKLTALQSEFTYRVDIDDEIIRLDTNKTYQVKGIGKDPADVVYSLQLRSSADAG